MSDATIANVQTGAYLIAAVFFIVGLIRLQSPATARSGNAAAALGMLIAIVVTLLSREIVTWEWVIAGLVLGSVIGGLLAMRVQMTQMPQMVALLNGFGGGASMLVAMYELFYQNDRIAAGVTPDFEITPLVAIMASVVVGGVTLTGSVMAFAKLQYSRLSRPTLLPARNMVNLAFLIAAVALAGLVIVVPSLEALFIVMAVLALVLGVLAVIAIGGADMPVVISLLNSYSGVAGAMTGFVLDNNALIISGSLVGASGLILTRIMTRAMNRSLANVMLGGFGVEGGSTARSAEQRPVRSVSAEESATVLGYARSVIFVPGYGLAVAQAQHNVRELADLLKARGVEVKYAIHPVAGRMPGHMNVLLAEASVPYDELYDLDQINAEFDRTDVALVVGANDVTNPSARSDKSSPIYGMPILNVDKAQSVIFMKRSMATGFSGVDNELFYLDKTMMLFGDAKKSMQALVNEVKAL